MTAPAYHTHPGWHTWLKAIRANPSDDTVRLIAADWLDENGHGGRAELVRLGVETARMKKRQPELTELFRHGPGRDEVRTFPRYAKMRMREHELRNNLLDHLDLPAGSTWETARGFLVQVQLPFSAWTAHAHAILPESVGLTVRLTDRPVVMLSGDAPAGLTMEQTRVAMTNLRCQLRGENGWAGDWHPGSLPVEDLLRKQWPDVAAWEVPAENVLRLDGLVSGRAVTGHPEDAASGLHRWLSVTTAERLPRSIDAPPPAGG